MSEAMKPIERVVSILQHKEADRVPVYPLICGASRRLTGASYKDWTVSSKVTAEAIEAATRRFGLDVVVSLTDLSVEAGDFGAKLIFPENEAAHPDPFDRMLKDIEDLDKIEPIKIFEGGRMAEHVKLCDKLVRRMGKEYPITAFVFGPLGILSMLRGQADLYMDIVDDPEAVERATGAINETLIEYCDKLMETGVNAIMLDTLFSSGSIMSKQMWRDTEGEHVRRLADHIHSKGCAVMIHNCGDRIYFDAQIETMKPEAISFLHLPDDIKTSEELKAKYGGMTTLIGHISPTWAPTAPEAELRAEIRRQIDAYKKDGGFILATGCEYPANADFRAAEIMVEEAKTYGVYR